jgi:hypothetical protein
VKEADIRLKRLHKSCEVTLERYKSVANDTCNLMGRLRLLPLSKDKSLEIFHQKKKEDDAHDAYQKARKALIAAIEADPELVNSWDPEKSAPRKFTGTPRSGAYRRRTG